MGLSVKVGSFSLNTTTGSQSVTGVGFQPKVVLFFGTQLTAVGSSAAGDGYKAMYGAMSGSGAQWAVYGDATDNVATQVTSRNCAPLLDGCILYGDTANVVKVKASFVSFDADGFTINLSTATAGWGCKVAYIALGGTDLSAKVGSIATPASAGDVVTTGVGFKPDAMLFLSAGTYNAGTSASMFAFGLGVQPSLTQYAITNRSRPTNPSNSKSNAVASKICSAIASGSDSIALAGSLTALGADGFTTNWNPTVNAIPVFYVALKGLSVAVGTFNQPSATGTQSITTNTAPSLLMLFSANAASSTSVQGSDGLSIGAAAGVSASVWFGEANNVTPTRTDSDYNETSVLRLMTGGTPAVNAAASLSSFGTTGFVINWTAADATARAIYYLALGQLVLKSYNGTITGQSGVSATTKATLLLNKSYTGAVAAQSGIASTCAFVRKTLFSVTGSIAATSTVQATTAYVQSSGTTHSYVGSIAVQSAVHSDSSVTHLFSYSGSLAAQSGVVGTCAWIRTFSYIGTIAAQSGIAGTYSKTIDHVYSGLISSQSVVSATFKYTRAPMTFSVLGSIQAKSVIRSWYRMVFTGSRRGFRGQLIFQLPEDLREAQVTLLGHIEQLHNRMTELETSFANETYVAPEKPREGMIRFADGTRWNPGSGRGLYVYSSAAWSKL